MSFEDNLKRIEEITCLLKEELSLQEALDLYKEAKTLAKDSQNILQEAKLQIQEVD